ncbi:MAG TPA: hypothetical protein VFK33_08095 [Bacillales bacterium]|nr:hypothetical protein [Bacillales bacterium]
MSGNLRPILVHYDLYPDQVKTIGKVKKIGTAAGTYALKETDMTTEQRAWFVHVIERLHRLGFDHFAAPIRTKQGEPVTVIKGKTYYVMPWLEEQSAGILSPEERLIETSAVLHFLTEKEQPYSDEVVQSSYQHLVDRWTKHQKELEGFAADTEEKLYFSAFELAFLTCYREVKQAADEALHNLSLWKEQCQDKERFRIVLCHGKLSTSHFIDGRLLNFEQAELDAPVRDLAVLFRSSLLRLSSQAEDPYDWLQTYEERFPLRLEEKQLLAAYLAFPESICQSVREHRNPSPGENEAVRAQKLEQRFHRFKELRRLADRIAESDGNRH